MDGLVPVYKTIFANHETDEDFTLTQLEKLLPLGKEKIETYLLTGAIKYSMTVKEIKETVATIKALEKKTETETESESSIDTEIETSTETESEVSTETESEVSTENTKTDCYAKIEIWNDCIFVNDEKYEFSDLNKVVKYIKETVKKLNK